MIGETCFFLENDGTGRELGDGDIENADPAYMSGRTVIATACGGGVRRNDFRSFIRICFGPTISGLSGPSLSVVPATIGSSSPPSFFALLIFESSDSPRLKIVTCPTTMLAVEVVVFFVDLRSSELDLFEIDGSD